MIEIETHSLSFNLSHLLHQRSNPFSHSLRINVEHDVSTAISVISVACLNIPNELLNVMR